MDTKKKWETGLIGYADTPKAIVATFPYADLLEPGAGRRPSFAPGNMPSRLGVRDIHRRFSDLAAKRNWMQVSSYAYIEAYK